MTKAEKKEAKDLKRAQRIAKKMRNETATTLRWMDLQKVEDDRVIVARGSKKYIIKGIKLTPNNIFISRTEEQRRWIENISFSLNSGPKEMWFEFVQAPVNCDRWINVMQEQMRNEPDYTLRSLINTDLNKIYDFQATHKEKEFYILIRNQDERILDKDFTDLIRLWNSAGFSPKQLNKRDYYSLVQYYFENDLITNYTFTRGIYSFENAMFGYNEDTDRYEVSNNTEFFGAYDDPNANARISPNLIQRSKIAPVGIKIKRNYMMMGDKFMKMLLVTNLPDDYYLGLLCEYLNDPHIKIFLKAERLDMDMNKFLQKDLNESQTRYQKSRDETEKRQIEADIMSQRQYIDSVVRQNDRTHNLTLIFQIVTDTETELFDEYNKLKSALQIQGFRVNAGVTLQEQLFKLSTPLFVNVDLPAVTKFNIGLPVTSHAIAGLYPWIYETLNDPHGFLFGEELQNRGKIMFDILYYLHDKSAAQIANRVNGNMIIVGQSGSGKSTAMAELIREFIKNRLTTIWVDPENKNEVLTKKYHGTYIDWGIKGNIINPFDLKPISSDAEDDNVTWDTELAINNVIEDITNIFMFLFPRLSEDALSFVGVIVKKLYAKFGFKPDAKGNWPSFKGIPSSKMPIFSDFNVMLEEEIERRKGIDGEMDNLRYLNELERRMARILNEWSVYFNGHTTIRIDANAAPIISFGTKKLYTSSNELQNALYYIMFTYAWSLSLDDSYESAFIVDEAQSVIQRGDTARLMAQFVRRSRKYRNSMVIATQEPHDFADEAIITDGKAIFNNSSYKLVLGLNHDATQDLVKLENLNENEQLMVESFSQGDGLLIVGEKRRITMHVDATRAELVEIGAMLD